MTGDPKVLAGLQQAYLASDRRDVLLRIQNAWDYETTGGLVPGNSDAAIRAWTPPAESSLEQRVATLSVIAAGGQA